VGCEALKQQPVAEMIGGRLPFQVGMCAVSRHVPQDTPQ
jgi:hypothetical protein